MQLMIRQASSERDPMAGYIADLEAERGVAWRAVNLTRAPLARMFGVGERAVDALYLAFGRELDLGVSTLGVQDVGGLLRRLGHVPLRRPRMGELSAVLARRAKAIEELRRIDALLQVLDARERA